ncbi:MAG: class I tRNA ligase family protein, partial [Actinobacteria bacterium]|nr:class I tRNA ligase family protein [Actinomycetota bacterium]
MPFGPVEPLDLVALEERVLDRWRHADVIDHVRRLRKDGEPWVFYEGPPTANGRPGLHHVWPRVFKDLYPRFQTMRGRRVPRKGGWDCHGLPVELEVEKEQMGPPVGAAIAVEVSGPDFHQVGELARKLKRELAQIPGVAELSDDYRVGRPEMRLRIDRGAAKRVGASTQSIAGTIRTAVAGTQ